jgi:hypothetical protein
MASVQASSPIKDLSSDNIGQGVFVNTIASMNLFATSNVTFWCWGTFCSVLALGSRAFLFPLDVGGGSTWVDGAGSDSDDLFRRAVFWHLSSGGAIDPGGFWGFGRRGCAITVSAQLRYFSNGILVVYHDLSRHTWSRGRTCCW